MSESPFWNHLWAWCWTAAVSVGIDDSVAGENVGLGECCPCHPPDEGVVVMAADWQFEISVAGALWWASLHSGHPWEWCWTAAVSSCHRWWCQGENVGLRECGAVLFIHPMKVKSSCLRTGRVNLPVAGALDERVGHSTRSWGWCRTATASVGIDDGVSWWESLSVKVFKLFIHPMKV